jgi:hypothetical protein
MHLYLSPMTEPASENYPVCVLVEGDLLSGSGSTQFMLDAEETAFVYLFILKTDSWDATDAMCRTHAERLLKALLFGTTWHTRVEYGHDAIKGAWTSSAKITLKTKTPVSLLPAPET